MNKLYTYKLPHLLRILLNTFPTKSSRKFFQFIQCIFVQMKTVNSKNSKEKLKETPK